MDYELEKKFIKSLNWEINNDSEIIYIGKFRKIRHVIFTTGMVVSFLYQLNIQNFTRNIAKHKMSSIVSLFTKEKFLQFHNN